MGETRLMRRLVGRTGRTAACLLAVAAVALATACGPDAAGTPGGPSDSGGAAAATPEAGGSVAPSRSPLPGSVTVQGLAFRPPAGFHHVPRDRQRNDNAAYELVGRHRPPAAAPAIEVFVERGAVGPLAARAASIRDLAQTTLTDPEIVAERAISVPGALGGRMIELTYTCQPVGEHGRPLPCHQVEVLVQMPQSPQYGLRYFSPEHQFDPAVTRQLLTSLRTG